MSYRAVASFRSARCLWWRYGLLTRGVLLPTAIISLLLSTAPSTGAEPGGKSTGDHWAFQKPIRPAVPVAEIARLPAAASIGPNSREPDNGGGRLTNPIDAFISHEHANHGLTPQPPAAKQVLLRRVYLDLIGLPPTRDELHAFLADDSPDAYAQVVDRLLNSPQYGERWARHWMDVWRYSDWYGRRHVPDVWNSAPQIWRWRDWIVTSLSEDKGYDQMIREMLAGDEIRGEDPQTAVATGYLVRNWYALNPNDWMRNNVEHTGKAFLGLTFNCAHCHDHKYDPITQEDYFRFRAFFEPIYIRQDRVAGEADPGPFQDYDYSTVRKIQRLGAVRVFDKNPEAPTWFYTGGDERNRLTERGSIPPGIPEFLARPSQPAIETVELPPRAWYPGLNPAIQETVLDEARLAITQAQTELAAVQALDSSTTPAHDERIEAAKTRLIAAEAHLAGTEARIAADRARYGETPAADPAALARTASQLERHAALQKLQADLLSQQHALAVAEAKPQSDANRAQEIESVNSQISGIRAAIETTRTATEDTTSENYTPLSPTYPKTSTGRRRALAEWIASPNNPLTARVAVNHIWMRHFHAPLIETVFDFGRSGAAPTHPELLDWLAVEFIDSGWSMKHLHRLMVTSETYQRDSAVGGLTDNVSIDPENRYLWRMNTGRIESEVLRDSLLYVANQLDLTAGGQERENTDALTTCRRSLYYSTHPEQGGKSALGELFDASDGMPCYRRTRSIVPQQALALTNSELVHKLSGDIVRRWHQDETNERTRAGDHQDGHQEQRGGDGSDDRFIIAMFERILSRRPTPTERKVCLDALEEHRQLLIRQGAAPETTRARESLVRALLNHNDFLTSR